MSKLVNSIFQQYDIGSWWGAAKSTFSNAAIYMSIFNTAMIIPMAYITWISPWLQSFHISIPFWIFAVAVLVGGIAVMLFEYKVSTPSIYSFSNEQLWKHDNPMRNKLNNIEKRMSSRFDIQDERMDKLERMLEKIARN